MFLIIALLDTAHHHTYPLAAEWRVADADAVRSVRRLMHYELALFLLLPLFAAAMARGYGEF